MYFASDLKKTGADETVNFSSNRGGGALTEDGTAGHRKRRTPQDSVGDCGPSSASVAHESHDSSKTLPEAAQGDVPVPDQGVPKKKGGGPALEHANLDQEVHQAVYRYLRRCEGFSEAFRRQFHTFSVHPIAVERLERKLSLICRERRRRELKELSELSGTEDEQLVQSIPNSWRQVRLHSGHILSQIVARRKECFEKATQEVTTAAEMAAAAAAASIEKRKKKSKTVSHHRKEEEVDTDARHTFDSSLRRSCDNTVKNTQQNGDDTLHVGGRTDNVPSPNVGKVGCDVKTRSPQSHETQPPLVPHATPPFPDSESTCDERPTREVAAPLLPRASPQLELPEASNRKSRSSMEVRGATPPPHERKAVRSPPLSVHPLHPIQPPWMNSPISNNTKHSSVRSKHGENVSDNTDRKEPAVPKGDVREQGHPGSGRRSRKSQQLSSDEEGEAESVVVGVSETKREPNQNTPLWPVTPSQSSRLKNPQTNLSTSRHRTTSKKEITHSLSSDDDTENDPMQGRGVAEKLFETPTAQKSKPSTHQSSKKHNSSVGVENTTTPTPVTRLLRSHTAAAASTALKKRQFSSDEEEDVIPVKSTTDHRSKRTRQL